MKLWPIYSLLLMAGLPAARAADLGTAAENGKAALAEGLWEVAEAHFRQALEDPKLADAGRVRLTLSLAETLIREGNAGAAWDLLGQSYVAKDPATPFWQAQALVGLGKFSEAAARFDKLLGEPAAPFRREAAFTATSLRLALDEPDAALATLDRLSAAADPLVTAAARLFQVEILLDSRRPVEARKIMPAAADVAVADRALAELLEGRLSLAEGHLPEALEKFQVLLSQPRGQTLRNFQAAAIGRADAMAAQGNEEVAAVSLLGFIQDRPEAPMLDRMFERILKWLPEKPQATDPIVERVSQWVPPNPLPASGLIAPGDTAAAPTWPADAGAEGNGELAAWAIYTRAIGLHRMGTPEARAEARRLLQRLRVESPGNFLANRGLFQMARWNLDDGETDRTIFILEALRTAARLPEMKGRAAFLQARVSYENGDPEAAIRLFDEAADSLESAQARIARLDAAIARLRVPGADGVALVQNDGKPADAALKADLSLERALATKPAAERRKALEEFSSEFPDHPRAAEARLAAAEAALESAPPDLAFAKSQLDALAKTPATAAALPAPQVGLTRLRIADLSQEPAAVIAAAQDFITKFPEQPETADAELMLGRALFEAGNYNQARLVLEKLATADEEPARAQVAWLLAARAAALGGTPQSKEEALGLFQHAIDADGPLDSIAKLEMARHLMDLYRLGEAADFLQKWIRTLPADDPLQLPAGLLLGEALYAQGDSNPDSLSGALAIYDKLLPLAKARPALFDRLQYLRGTVLEKLPDKTDPSKTREKEAFQAYHSVLEIDGPPAEWEFFENCGFRALALLEKAGRWPAAIAVAKKIASFDGPRAKDAASLASQLQLKHMIWED